MLAPVYVRVKTNGETTLRPSAPRQSNICPVPDAFTVTIGSNTSPAEQLDPSSPHYNPEIQKYWDYAWMRQQEAPEQRARGSYVLKR